MKLLMVSVPSVEYLDSNILIALRPRAGLIARK